MCIVQPAAKRGGVISPGPRHLLVRKQEGIAAQEEEATAASFLPQLDLLWHYDCVVSPILDLPTSPAHYPVHSPSSTSAAAAVLNPAPSSDSPHLSSLVVGGAAEKKSHLQRRVLQRVFTTFDRNRDGRVSNQEITQIFHRLGITPHNQDSIHSLLARLVPGSEGHVDEQEFSLLYDSVCCTTTAADEPADFARPAPAIPANVEQDLLAAFHVFDKDGNGFITPKELQTVLCALGFPQARQLDACVDMIARVDENGDGQVDFLEFKRLFDMENASLLLVSSF